MHGRLLEAKNLATQGAAYGAFVRLGEVLAEAGRLTTVESQDSWRKTILEEAGRIELDAVRGEALNNVARLSQITSAGGVFDKYEIVLLLTLRIQLESAQVLFDALGQAGVHVSPSLDGDLRILREDQRNGSAYQAACQMIVRNWGFPVKSEWLA